VQQPDGTLAHIPRWMMEETAARHALGSHPRLPLDHLRNLRLEIDALLNFLQPDSNAEEAVNEAEVCKAASGSLRERQKTGLHCRPACVPMASSPRRRPRSKTLNRPNCPSTIQSSEGSTA
jgi:hypothetical protein